ncbi:MAG TPA: hypothetical protein P5191_09685 [Ruminococcus sp.]|nr:hypothetical protein [Ruminococcus sp.]
MASETVKKILEAEALADRKTSEARQRRDDVINDAQGKAALTVQKSLTEASKESGRIKAELEKNLMNTVQKPVSNAKKGSLR